MRSAITRPETFSSHSSQRPSGKWRSFVHPPRRVNMAAECRPLRQPAGAGMRRRRIIRMSDQNLERRDYLAIPRRLNMATAIVDRHVAAGRGEKIAAWFGDRSCSYAELRELSNRFGNVLRGLGVARGDTVFLRLGTNLHTMVAVLGAMKIGAVAIPSSFLF